MAATLIDRIEIRKDGVYLSTHLPEDTGSYKTWKSEELSVSYTHLTLPTILRV